MSSLPLSRQETEDKTITAATISDMKPAAIRDLLIFISGGLLRGIGVPFHKKLLNRSNNNVRIKTCRG